MECVMGDIIKTLVLIVACAPILFWLSKIATAFILYKLSPPHYVTMQFEDKDGRVRNSMIVDVSKDKHFYAAIVRSYKESQHKEGKLSD
ncbi:hypothetical protein C9E85_15370 [Plesiomonas shigelloides]|nr:hypothetical protein C9E85_15370 [Plesiomonas shigelloides]